MSSHPDLNPAPTTGEDPGELDSLSNSGTSQIDSTSPASDELELPAERLSNWYEAAVQPVTDKTAMVYRRNYFRLVDRAAAARNVDPDFISISDLIELLDADTTITTGTKNTYRAAIVWALSQPDMGFSPAMREAGLKLARAFDPRNSARQEIVRNSRVSARAIPEQDLGPLLNGLLAARSSRQAWGTKTTAWLNAGIATGARPGEWQTAYWFDRDRRILRLPNSKLKKQATLP